MTDFSIKKTIGEIGPQGPTGPTGRIGPTGPSGSTSGGSASNSSEFQINIPNQLTKIKKTINFSNKGTILPSDIICSLDNELLEQSQMYTFGPSIPNRWVSVGTGTNDSIAYSNDGINWTGAISSLGESSKNIFSITGNGVAWNGKMWVAVGEGTNSIAYSDDGINWTPVNVQDFSKGNGIACNEFGWIAVGKQNGTNKCFIQISKDGINWIASDRTFTVEANGVAFNGQKCVIVGTDSASNNCIVYASNIDSVNRNFNSAFIRPDSNGNPVVVTSMKSVAWNGSLWVAVGTSCILTSVDGIIWDKSYPPIVSSITTFDLNTVAWNGNVWVAGGKIELNNSPTCSFIYSYDGFDWKPVSTIPILTEVFSIEWNGSSWIGIGDDNYAYSRDGITSWVKNKSASLFTKGKGVCYNSARQNKILFPCQELYASGENGFSISDIIGNNWGTIAPNIPNIVFHGVANGGDRNLVLADFISTPFNSCMVLLSLNPYNSPIIIENAYSTRANAAAWNGKLWISVGEGTNTIMSSNNGESWTPINIFSTSGNAIAYNANRWVAVGSDSTGKNIAYSDNGTDWTKSDSVVFSNGGKGLAHNGNRWVAVGADSNGNTIYYSDDNGKTWLSEAVPKNFSISGNGVAWNGNMWVAVGEDSDTNNNILISPDGKTWSSVGDTIFTKQGNSVVWVKDRWFAGGEGTNDTNTMYSSKNGSTWDIVSNPFTTKITNLSTNLNTSFIDIPNPITVNKNDKLDIVSGSYYNNSYTNFSCNIKPSVDSN
jgi:hypothetical protein